MTIREQLVCNVLSGTWTYRPAGIWQWMRWAIGKSYRSPLMDPQVAARNAVALADAALAELERRKP